MIHKANCFGQLMIYLHGGYLEIVMIERGVVQNGASKKNR